MNSKIIFITSLERSGSTLIDLTLGRHSNLVSFGEVSRVLQPHGGGIETTFDRPCSCGKNVNECKFWSSITYDISKNENMPLSKRYEIFLSKFNDVYGDNKIPVDSTKYLKALPELGGVKDLDIKVVNIIRDVRGWMHSSKLAAKRKQEMPYSKIFDSEIRIMWKAYLRFNVLRKLPFWLPLEWYIRNKLIINYLSQNNHESLLLSYEKFAFDTENTLSSVFDFVGVENESSIIKNKSEHHIVRGNRMAFNEDTNNKITYDKKWMASAKLPYSLLPYPFIMKINSRWVYRNN